MIYLTLLPQSILHRVRAKLDHHEDRAALAAVMDKSVVPEKTWLSSWMRAAGGDRGPPPGTMLCRPIDLYEVLGRPSGYFTLGEAERASTFPVLAAFTLVGSDLLVPIMVDWISKEPLRLMWIQSHLAADEMGAREFSVARAGHALSAETLEALSKHFQETQVALKQALQASGFRHDANRLSFVMVQSLLQGAREVYQGVALERTGRTPFDVLQLLPTDASHINAPPPWSCLSSRPSRAYRLLYKNYELGSPRPVTAESGITQRELAALGARDPRLLAAILLDDTDCEDDGDDDTGSSTSRSRSSMSSISQDPSINFLPVRRNLLSGQVLSSSVVHKLAATMQLNDGFGNKTVLFPHKVVTEGGHQLVALSPLVSMSECRDGTLAIKVREETLHMHAAAMRLSKHTLRRPGCASEAYMVRA